MKIARDWKDYSVIATGDGYKLERWKDVYLLRPDPQAIWHAQTDMFAYPKLNAYYKRSEKGGGGWTILKPFPPEWNISYEKLGLTFKIKPMGFKHTGLFPEQAVNWETMHELISRRKAAGKDVKVLNLFAYTGGATVACAKAGASVTHVDAAKGMVERAGENAPFRHRNGRAVYRGRLLQVCAAGNPPRKQIRRDYHGPAFVRERSERRNVENRNGSVRLRGVVREGAFGRSAVFPHQFLHHGVAADGA